MAPNALTADACDTVMRMLGDRNIFWTDTLSGAMTGQAKRVGRSGLERHGNMLGAVRIVAV